VSTGAADPRRLTSLRRIEQFIYAEARFADEHDYDSWEALWTDDALYWVPAGGDLPDPDAGRDPGEQMSVIYDNRRRIATRLAQLRTGRRYAQTPPSGLRRVISNIEVLDRDQDEVVAAANFILAESRERGTEIWAGRVTYRLRLVDDQLRLAAKTVLLVNRDRPLPTLAFLI
jgi:benzoate/toluate 1,2-dioxygenase beta subunit